MLNREKDNCGDTTNEIKRTTRNSDLDQAQQQQSLMGQDEIVPKLMSSIKQTQHNRLHLAIAYSLQERKQVSKKRHVSKVKHTSWISEMF